MTLKTCDGTEIFSWLAEASLKGLAFDALLAGFCERLDANGFALRRGHVSTATVHPAVTAHGVTWRRGKGTERASFEHSDVPGPAWHTSPFHYMLKEDVRVLRRRLSGQGAQLDFPILREFAAEGMTGWMAALVGYNWDAAHIEGGQMGTLTSWGTDHPQGFSDAQAEDLQRLVRALGAAVKLATVTDIAHEVLAAYLGRDAARRVLSGAITRGSVQRLDAVLFFADLRDFTRFSAGRPIEDVVALLNTVFERVGEPIRAHGGEILKFIGDGLLAAFLLDGRSTAAAADAALEAALDVQRAIAALPSVPALDIALHLGEVHYGNIGAADRLDFTVIGSAVNEVARLEELCGPLHEPILVSAVLRGAARSMAARLVPLGRRVLRGMSEPSEIFALRRA